MYLVYLHKALLMLPASRLEWLMHTPKKIIHINMNIYTLEVNMYEMNAYGMHVYLHMYIYTHACIHVHMRMYCKYVHV